MNNTLWILFEIGANLSHGLMTTIFLHRTLDMKRTPWWGSIINSIIFTFLCSLYLFFELPIADSWIFIVPFIYSLIFATDKKGTVLLWNIILVAIFNGVISVCYSVFIPMFNISSTDLLEPSSFRIIFVVSTNIFLFSILMIISRKTHKRLDDFFSISLFILINLLVVFIIDLLYSIKKVVPHIDKQLLLVSSLTLCISISSILLYEIMATYANRYLDSKRKEDQQRLVLQRQEDLQDMYMSLHILRHDLKNHIQIAQMLLSEGKAAEGTDYLSVVEQEVFTVFSTGCLPLDTTLTMKELLMKKNNIQFRHQLCSLDIVPIDETDFCSIIFNLLDNAIDGASKCETFEPPRVIDLRMVKLRHTLCIKCTNTINPQYIRTNKGKYMSTKLEGGHGLGITSITSIVERANGTSFFSNDEKTFIVEITLPYREDS